MTLALSPLPLLHLRLPQQEPLDLAARRLRQFGDEIDLAREQLEALSALDSRNTRNWDYSELSVWRRRIGVPGDPPTSQTRPWTTELTGDLLGAADQWEQLGLPYEAALALVQVEGDGAATALGRAAELFDSIEARKAAAFARRRAQKLGVSARLPKPRRGPYARARQHPLGADVRLHIGGQGEELGESVRSLLFAFGLAVFLVYLVMASQFESLLHPFVILFTIPLALVGAVLALLLTRSPVSSVVFIGLILLVGLVVKNAIILIDKVNQLREQGVHKREALVEGARSRLRPIMMTTLCTLFGFLPLALAFGEGAEVRSPMAITVIGGLLVSTLLTLVVIPVVYDLLDRKPDGYYAERGRRARHDAEEVAEGLRHEGDALGEGA